MTLKLTMAKAKEAIGKIMKNAVDLLSSLFMPFINLMVAAGILRGIFALLSAMNLIYENTPTYMILNAMSDAFFYFIPVFLAYTAANKIDANRFTAILIACILLHPDISALMQNGAPVDLFGIPIQAVTYSSSVIPILLGVFCMGYIEKICQKYIPKDFQDMFTPVICILIVLPMILMIFGPIGHVIGNWLAQFYETIYSLNPAVAGFLIGALQPYMVLFGLHWALFPIALNNIAIHGFDTILVLFGGAIFAQGGAVLAVAFAQKERTVRMQAVSASLTTLLGITEPAMFGFNLPLKKPMLCASLAGGVGSAIAGYFKCRATAFALPALTTLPVFMSHAFIPFLISLITAFGLAFIFTLFVNVPEKKIDHRKDDDYEKN